ncbi:hypothetical protein ES703_104370 [subsurface metagenome]
MKKSVEIDEKGYEAAFACVSEGTSDFDIIREFKEVVAREGGDISLFNTYSPASKLPLFQNLPNALNYIVGKIFMLLFPY